ncbi:hypothetical protein [Halomonas sp. KO116]|uniref:hypothetical protein n=1 Tax=Halomonas sp. KO116 TaxID=1504981 RepID=UPI0004E38690|nr:hypothetical protein [Halomonas sp. KO116]AJY49983.1 hypothetical protein KO116_01496 [Halomonas sp. KO116]
MKTTASICCLAAVLLVLSYIGERSLFFSNYPMFVTVFAALALLISAMATWVGASGSAGDKTESNDTSSDHNGNDARANTEF